jgi:hypothetical protein
VYLKNTKIVETETSPWLQSTLLEVVVGALLGMVLDVEVARLVDIGAEVNVPVTAKVAVVVSEAVQDVELIVEVGAVEVDEVVASAKERARVLHQRLLRQVEIPRSNRCCGVNLLQRHNS